LLPSFLSHVTPPTDTSPLSLHDALPILAGPLLDLRQLLESFLVHRLLHVVLRATRAPQTGRDDARDRRRAGLAGADRALDVAGRSEEHTSELPSPTNIVCRLLLEKKKTT